MYFFVNLLRQVWNNHISVSVLLLLLNILIFNIFYKSIQNWTIILLSLKRWTANTNEQINEHIIIKKTFRCSLQNATFPKLFPAESKRLPPLSSELFLRSGFECCSPLHRQTIFSRRKAVGKPSKAEKRRLCDFLDAVQPHSEPQDKKSNAAEVKKRCEKYEEPKCKIRRRRLGPKTGPSGKVNE